MARILITSGPTRQFIDPVRYISNGSSGRMGCALAAAAINAGHEVVVVSGPVNVVYPAEAEVIHVISTEEMLEASLKVFGDCDGLIGVAAPCDYRPIRIATEKIAKIGDTLDLKLIETPDIIAALNEIKELQWMVAFALETADGHLRAMQKLERKKCDLIVLNGPESMFSKNTRVEVIAADGQVLAELTGNKTEVAVGLLAIIQERLIK